MCSITSVFADTTFNTNLKYGATGEKVKEVQDFLIDQGLLTPPITGRFYSLTRNAVKAFQTKNNLPVSGFWGPLTREAANKIVDIDNSVSNSQEKIETGIVTPINLKDLCINFEGIQNPLPQGMFANGDYCFYPTVNNYNTTVVQQTTTTQTNQQVPQVPSTPVPTTQFLTSPIHFAFGRQTSWLNGNTTGSMQNSCTNCIALKTKTPTTAKVYLMEYTTIRSGKALDDYAKTQNIVVYTDQVNSDTHVFLFKDMNMDKTKKYLFKVEATDQNAITYIQNFSGVDENSNFLPGPFTWGDGQVISWWVDEPSEYKNNN